MAPIKTVIIAVVAAVLILGSQSLFTVKEWERALVFRLGEIVRADISPGLHFKIPFIQNVRKFDGRILTMDAEPERYLTVEKKNLIVDSFVKWRIEDVGQFYRATQGGDERIALQRLSQIIKDGLRSEFAKRTVQDVVSGERGQIMDILTIHANRQVAGLGISIIDVRIKRIDLPAEVSASVYRRMEAERSRVAREFRSRGAEAAERIRADADRQRQIILAEAYRDSERIRGDGDAQAAATYAAAFGQDADFYSLHRSLASYRATFRDRSDLLVMEPDGDFFRYFRAMTGAAPQNERPPEGLQASGSGSQAPAPAAPEAPAAAERAPLEPRAGAAEEFSGRIPLAAPAEAPAGLVPAPLLRSGLAGPAAASR
jgi:modulator of FtsH protease HflC